MSDTDTSPLPDMIDDHSAPSMRRKKRRRRRSSRSRMLRRVRTRLDRVNWKITLILVIGVIAAIVLVGVIIAMNSQERIETSWDGLSRVWTGIGGKPGTDLTLQDFERLQLAVHDMRASLAAARQQTIFLRPLTFASADLDASLEALSAAEQMTLAAEDILAGMEPTIFFLTAGEEDEAVGGQLSSGERLVELLNLGRGRFVNAEKHLDNAEATINGLDKAEISQELLIAVNGLAQYQQELRDITQMLQASPELLTEVLGLNEPKTYLVLAQNNDELRPSGGYLSTYGYITIRNGRVVNYDYSPTTANSPNPPPEEYVTNVTIPHWWIQYGKPLYAAWDGSWYVDFPATAEMAAWYYDTGGNPGSPVDGVIAIDLIGFEYLIAELDTVYIEAYDVDISADNFRALTYEIRVQPRGGDLAHKQFVSAVYRQILADWQGVDQEKSVKMRGAALQALQEKHIMVYFTDPELNEAAEVLGWSGHQKPAVDNDYLLVAEANMGNKANRSVQRMWTYDVEIRADGTLLSRAAIAYDYPDRIAALDPAVHPNNGDLDYSSIVQIFVPVNSILLNTTNLRLDPTIVNGDTHTTFVARVKVDYNANERISLTYETPVLVEAFGPYRRYELVLQKQPGALPEQVNVQVTLPVGATVIDTNPEPVASYRLEQRILEFKVTLDRDQRIEVIFTQ